MAKLYFRHGPMGAGKSLKLMAVAHTYEHQKKKVLVIKPGVDTRSGRMIGCRAPISREVDHIIGPDTVISNLIDEGEYSCILVDEAQFLTPKNVEELRDITFVPGIPVICFGLRTDFMAKLFPGSKRLFELADSIEEIKTTCQYCNRKAVFNLRYRMGEMTEAGKTTPSVVPVVDGPQVVLGADDSYMPLCYGCFPHEEIIHGAKHD